MILFRFPFGDDFYTLNKDSENHAVQFFPFDEAETINFKGSIAIISEEKVISDPLFTDEINSVIPKKFQREKKDHYIQKLQEVIAFIKQNQLSKLVISRRKTVDYSVISSAKKLNLSCSFLQLCQNYPNAFVYLFHQNGICWMGAFSELLGKFNKKTSEFETMSLAGTLPVNENWTSKEIEEQWPVTDYISTILKKFSANVQQSGTYDHHSGNIKHLRTDFKMKTEAQYLNEIISELHPTPAVCGIPKEFCKKAILGFEAVPRELYSGYIRIETETEIQFFVNLRCAQFFRNGAILYVGGGITAKSNPDDEWRETELKSEAILKNLVTA